MQNRKDPFLIENDLETFYKQTVGPVFLLAFVHTARLDFAKDIIQKVFLLLFARPQALANAPHVSLSILSLTERFCQRFYQDKLRRKVKEKYFDGGKLPFPHDRLLEILRLPARMKTPLVLDILNLPEADRVSITGLSPAKLQKELTSAYAALPYSKEQLSESLLAVALSEEACRRLWNQMLLTSQEKGFRFHQTLRHIKRWLDDHAIYIALLLVLFFLLAYFGVQYGWF